MNSTEASGKTGVKWDLSVLFDGIDDPKIDQTWSRCLDRASRFAEQYRGRLCAPDLDAETLLAAIKEIESIYQEVSKPVNYAHLLHACDTSSHEIGAFMQRQMEKLTEINVAVMFYELEIQKADEAVIGRLMQDPLLEPYRHHVKVARSFSAHRLSEPEEIILEQTANTGNRAWMRLFEEVTANHRFPYTDPDTGQTSDLILQEALDMLRRPSRKVRQAAADAISEGLNELQRVLCFTYNNLILDKKTEDRLRKLEYPEHSRHLANELDKETVDLVIDLCRQHYGLVSRFYKVKRQILGLPELTHIDRYAPLFEADEKIPYEQGTAMVLNAFSRFSKEMGDRAREFVEHRWIDAEPRPGKQAGAFAAYVTPDTHPFVFVNYLDKPVSVSTLAHELGHGVHASLSREQTFFNFLGTLPLAELASTFGEMLVFEDLVSQAGKKDKLALYADKIENTFATVFRQAAMFRFEQRCHEHVRTKGELSPQAFGDIWQEEIQAMFGDSLTLGDQHRIWWSVISHVFCVPFYVYAYSFGELLVLSLYQMAKKEGPEFERKYIKLLRLGGSRSPQDLMATMGVDLKDKSFWLGGFGAMEALVAEFERLWAEYQKENQP